MDVLEQINSSADVKRLDASELEPLCAALRKEIIHTVSQNGGHLASSLGAVELTVALHRVYDSAKDRIVFDVGHQSYAHKLLTGRRERFSTLRREGGIAGFLRPSEAPDDAAVSGHASTSISVALGMARARTLLGQSYEVVAVVGDGALTGGVAYEGLNDAGESGERLVVVLNDNAMSISRNVGGMAQALAKARVRPGYLAFKRLYRSTVGRAAGLYHVLHRVKEWLKDLLLPDNMFEDMGFYYLGPIDGHDLKTLERTLAYARSLRCPVLVHVVTVKGKGYAPAERDPALYHGVGPFDPETGIEKTAENSFSARFGALLGERAAKDSRIVALTAAMADGTGLSEFARRFPGRLFDVGIAEQHAAAMAAGMARQGMTPVFAVYSSFLQRAYDILIHDIALSGEHVVLAVDRAGLVGPDGPTHQGAFDVGYLCQVPGMAVWAPSNYAELEAMLDLALCHPGPCALRYAKGAEGAFRADSSDRDVAELRQGDDLTLVSYGVLINEVLGAADALRERGISAAVLKLNRLDRFDAGPIESSVRRTGRLLVAEDTAAFGCVGERLLADLSRRGMTVRGQCLLNLGEGVVMQGTVAEQRRTLRLDAEGIALVAEQMMKQTKE
ncbi:MAG: 1-deoxy-D-xylulose-5-phosphate synthase [Oscillospiraceae bacterium]|nr:1-deoxy-D-xylulose-5-phosphate synthase [Oscillospiraceae bacterium]